MAIRQIEIDTFPGRVDGRNPAPVCTVDALSHYSQIIVPLFQVAHRNPNIYLPMQAIWPVVALSRCFDSL